MLKMIVGLILIVVGFCCVFFIAAHPINIFAGAIFVLLGVWCLASNEKDDERKTQ